MHYKTYFFDIEDYEKEYLMQRLGTENVCFIDKQINETGLDEFKDAQIISGFIYSAIGEDLLSQLPNLKYIATRSTGFDHIDITAASNRNIPVSNVPTYGENTVAEHTFALLLALSRHIPESIERTKRGDFALDGLQGFDLKGRTIGVIGTGNIGLHVIRMAAGFEMHILAFSRTPKQDLIDKYGVRYVGLEEIFAESDILTLHVPENPQTHHMINQDNIHQIKRGAILINTSRGGLIETDALVRALDEGILSAAGLDVLEEEGLIKEERQLLSRQFQQTSMLTTLENHLLLTRPNVIVTPHNAFNSVEAIYRILDTTIENILSFEEGKVTNAVSIGVKEGV